MGRYEIDTDDSKVVQIKVVGVGGGGGNAVNRMVHCNIQDVEFVAVNSDKPALAKSTATHKILIGEKATKGMGAGARPEVGTRAAEESREALTDILTGAEMVFITAGMGGGTGTGAAPVVAKIAKDLGILTVAVVTTPFAFEGNRRMKQAQEGIKELAQYVDSIMVIPNENLKYVTEEKITLLNAFEIANDVLRQGVQSVSDLVNATGLVNCDFADVTEIMKDSGYAHMGVGRAKGKDKAELAAQQAISSPLLNTSIDGARGILINITASTDIGLEEIDAASSIVSAAVHPDCEIIWGANFDEELEDEMIITVIASFLSHKIIVAALITFNSALSLQGFKNVCNRSLPAMMMIGNLRKAVDYLTKYSINHDKEDLKEGLLIVLLLLVFIFGAYISAILSDYFMNKTILFLIPIYLVAVIYLQNDDKC